MLYRKGVCRVLIELTPRSLAILGTESHASMHNKAEKQSLTLYGELSPLEVDFNADRDRSTQHMCDLPRQEIAAHLAPSTTHEYRRDYRSTRRYRDAQLSSQPLRD